MHNLLVVGITVFMFVIGALILIWPRLLVKLEQHLNRPWGAEEIITLRLGSTGERDLEQWLNRPVLAQAVYWDRWTRKYPRLTGTVICIAALIIFLNID